MHPRVLAERNARAIAEMRTAIKELAEQEGIDPPDLPLRRGNEDPQVFQLREREMIAAFLGDLAGTRPEPEPAPFEDDAEEPNKLPAPETGRGEAASTPKTVEELPAPVPENPRRKG